MNRDAGRGTTSLQLARRLLIQEANQGGTDDQVGDELKRTYMRICRNLCDAMGQEGCNALLSRAMSLAETEHPALKDIREHTERGIHLNGVAAGVGIHGRVVVTAAVEGLLASLIDVLSRLIGDDMTMRLFEADNSG